MNFNEMEGADALNVAFKWISDGMDVEDLEMVLVVCDKKEGTVRVLGIRIDEEEVPSLLLSAAKNVAEHVVDTYEHRTIN